MSDYPDNDPGNGDAITTDVAAYDFQALCEPHYQALVAYASRLVSGRRDKALDIVQEAYLRAFKRWSGWRPSTHEQSSSSARGWLHTIVLNVFLDDARASTGRRKLLEEHHDYVLEQTYGCDEDYTSQPELSDGVGDEVRAALDELEYDQRMVVILADFQGEQYLAIAATLGIPLGTVMSRLHRGRKRLAAILESYAKDVYGIKKQLPRPKRLAKGTESGIDIGDDGDVTSVTGSTALVAPETLESDPDGVDGVMRRDDGSEFIEGEPGFDSDATGRFERIPGR